ncbi:unnamed protein product [Rodentolepis nana]|uniref:Uncharacterized protein n=1 Tax=Rodentolepis nana TaxID=102285 RepID=A0A158QH14_RODNA|nr:unnamed protein product [Rodentolepis nana]
MCATASRRDDVVGKVGRPFSWRSKGTRPHKSVIPLCGLTCGPAFTNGGKNMCRLDTIQDEVLTNSAPYPPADQVTHAFMKRRSNASSRSSGHSDTSSSPAGCQGYEWLKVEFLCAHLTGVGNTSRSEYIIDLNGEQEAATAPPAKRSRSAR